ncbi:probable methyltransferase-like protein 15 homolog isoform X2 [Octopus bimaculoides]|uniref:Uncharacterized protein n=1 Tax=Octopus bimaculoides TaxID=37653 RepID=A0A0L8HAV7_OCTBM|nr:probable methyltransferase-like protein 15 homolog isoform X2 [Octopus bimaculoides]|eukprot:XP_014773881.1 PREDICTED: probable methyltransferase-like protein 15 homolog isoform X2 [Octopus bimaculoides]
MHQTVIGFCLRLQRPLNFKLLPNYRFCSTEHVRQVKKPQTTKGFHIPVMLNEILSILNPQEGQVILDMTFGCGGHSREILQKAPQLKKLIVLDRDPLAHEIALDFANEFREPDQPTAADVVNTLDEKGLQELIKKYGEEKKAGDIAHAIVQFRAAFGKIVTTHQLATIVASVFDSPTKRDKLQRPAHVATKTFQALRIFVNNELNQLSNGLLVAHNYLKEGGVCAVISFHSLEDRIVKRHFHGIDINAAKNMSLSSHQFLSPSKIFNETSVQSIISKKWNPIQKKVIVPDLTEVEQNPRARSAKLRAAIKCSS